MKVFVLAQEVGGNAPGILYERLLRALSEHCTLDFAVGKWVPSGKIEYRSLQTFCFPKMKHWMKRILTVLFKGDIFSRRARSKIVFPEDTDVILSLCSNDRFWALEAGEYWAGKSGKPWACYFVDAIPSPVEWVGNTLYRRTVESIVRRVSGKISFLGGLSSEMLEYQKTLFPEQVSSAVFLPPMESAEIRPLPNPENPPLFLYAGRIYGRRSARHLLEAFSSMEGSARLVFAGSDRRIHREIKLYAPRCSDRIEVLPWVSDLEPLIARATALIDLDAELEKDVYLSSKLFTYLAYPRPIVNITGARSPARRLLQGLNSVLVCPHDSKSVEIALRRCINDFGTFYYSDRQALLEEADAAKIAARMVQELSAL